MTMFHQLGMDGGTGLGPSVPLASCFLPYNARLNWCRFLCIKPGYKFRNRIVLASHSITEKPNLYASRRLREMTPKWLFVCSEKIKLSCRAFLDGHPVKILKLSYQDMNQKCKTDQTNHIYFLQDLTQICAQKYNQKCNQVLNFPEHTKNNIWILVHIRGTSWRV